MKQNILDLLYFLLSIMFFWKRKIQFPTNAKKGIFIEICYISREKSMFRFWPTKWPYFEFLADVSIFSTIFNQKILSFRKIVENPNKKLKVPWLLIYKLINWANKVNLKANLKYEYQNSSDTHRPVFGRNLSEKKTHHPPFLLEKKSSPPFLVEKNFRPAF